MFKALTISSVVAALCLLGMAGPGCGSSDGTAATSLTRPQFIETADAICKKTDRTQRAELKAYLKDNPKAEANEAEQIKLVTSAGLPAVKAEIEELGELAAPTGGEEEVAAILGEMESALVESEADPSKVLGAAQSPFKDAEARASKYGFKECSSPL